jgi:hypothetical protein
MTLYTTPITAVAGAPLMPDDWNEGVRDNMAHLTEVQAWSPTVSQSGTVSRTLGYGRYWRSGKRVWAECLLTMTGSGGAATTITISLPVTAAVTGSGLIVCGSGYFFDASGGSFAVIIPLLNTTTTVVFRRDGDTAAVTTQLATSDVISLALFYEAA